MFSQNPATAAPIIDVTIDTFMEEVIDASKKQLVLVDFWAEWCGPCKQLTPLLEDVIAEERGAVKLVKINADQNPELIRQFRIQSLPTVIILKDGNPVSGFVGLTTAAKLKALLAKLKGEEVSEFQDLLEMAKEAKEQGDITTAFQLYAQILQKDPQISEAALGLVELYLRMGEVEKARGFFETLPEQIRTSPEAASLEAIFRLTKEMTLPDFQKNPAFIKKAYEMFLKGDRKASLEGLLSELQRGEEGSRDMLKSSLFRLLECLGHTHPLTIEIRKKISRILFS